jgi:hypothetical protein
MEGGVGKVPIVDVGEEILGTVGRILGVEFNGNVAHRGGDDDYGIGAFCFGHGFFTLYGIEQDKRKHGRDDDQQGWQVFIHQLSIAREFSKAAF